MTDIRRRLPAVSKLLEIPSVQEFVEKHTHEVVVSAIRDVLNRARNDKSEDQDWVDSIHEELQKKTEPSLRRVINATGVLLHTNLGRAPLTDEAFESARMIATGYSNLEYDLREGKRGSRYEHLIKAFQLHLPVEDALVVNNNAAATMLMLRALAKGKEVVISRGELVEIGGSFRIPEILEASGAKLKEVGTTNRTIIKDYEKGITAKTGMILKVHPSNYKIEGFTESVDLKEIVKLGKKYKIPVGLDQGSATIEEAKQILQTGVDLFCFSGDKLLGGPQSGILLGSKEALSCLKSDRWLRILRVDKITIKLLEHALKNHKKSFVYNMLNRTIEDLAIEADNIIDGVKGGGWELQVRAISTESTVGGGSLPEERIASRAVAIQGKPSRLKQLEKRLREGSPPVICRKNSEQILLDMRTVLPGESKILIEALKKAMQTVR